MQFIYLVLTSFLTVIYDVVLLKLIARRIIPVDVYNCLYLFQHCQILRPDKNNWVFFQKE